jgi:hypothetical protein
MVYALENTNKISYNRDIMLPIDLNKTANSFITPFYATYIEGKSNKGKPFTSEQLTAHYESFLRIRKDLEELGFLTSNDKESNLRFSAPEETLTSRRLRAIPLYSKDYIDFLQLDVGYKNRKKRDASPIDFATSPILSYSLATEQVTRLPLKNNLYFREAAQKNGLFKTDFARSSFSIEESKTIMSSLRDILEKDFIQRQVVMSEQKLRDFLSCVNFLFSAQSAIKLYAVSQAKTNETLDYVMEALVNDVEPLKIMLVFNSSFYSHTQLCNQNYIEPVISCEELIQYKDIPASYLQMIFSSKLEVKDNEIDLFDLIL